MKRPVIKYEPERMAWRLELEHNGQPTTVYMPRDHGNDIFDQMAEQGLRTQRERNGITDRTPLLEHIRNLHTLVDRLLSAQKP